MTSVRIGKARDTVATDEKGFLKHQEALVLDCMRDQAENSFAALAVSANSSRCVMRPELTVYTITHC